MATRATKTTAVATKAGAALALADIKAKLSEAAANLVEQIGQAAQNKIGTEDSQFKFPDGTVDAGPINLVILDFVSRNKYYTAPYKKGSISPPLCYAIGKNINAMKPSPKAAEPQAPTCAECPHNQWGSDGTSGKACKNSRFLAVVAPDDVSTDSKIMTLEVSPTALKNFDAMVNTIARLYETPPIGAVVEVSFNEGLKYPSLVFSRPEENVNLAAHYARLPEVDQLLFAELDTGAAPSAPPASVPPVRARARAGRA